MLFYFSKRGDRMSEKQRFTAQEKRIFAGCFICYMLCYVARMNLAGALPHVTQAFSLTDAQAGLIQTVFAVVYAAGQLINGLIVDHISPRRHVVIGLLGSALCNLLVGCSNTYWQILVLWGLNGVAQSMLWTPMVRLIAVWFDSKKRSVVSFWMCVCFIIGHLLAWAVSGLMAARFSWRTSFFAPAAVLVFATSVALYTLRDRTKEHSDDKAHVPPMPIREMLFGTGLWLIFLGCIATGFARDGVMTWAPTLIGALFSSQNASSGVIISLIIPLLNLMGLLLGQFLLRRSNGNLRPTICRRLIAAAICTLLLAVFHALPAFLFTLLLGILCGLMYSVSNMQNVILPLEYADTGRVSLIAGIADSMIYIGTSLVSVISGLLMQSVGQSAVYISWGIAAMISCTLTMLAGRTAKQ